jgi:hypothetical protein
MQPGAFELWVVNAGQLASNKVTFTVLTTDPVLTAITPTGGQTNQVTSITCSGSGFDASSVVRMDGQPIGNTTFVSGTRLVASPVDLKSVTAGAHAITVANGAKVSGPQTFTVSEAPPVALGISPGSARQGSTVTLTVTGTGFGAAPHLHAVEPGGAAKDVTPASSTPTQLTAPYSFPADGEYLFTVVNASGSSDVLPFRVLSNVAVLSGLAPATAAQGTTPTLTLTVQNMEAGAKVHLAGGGRDRDLPATVTPPTATAPVDLTGWDTGTYAVTVVNPGASPSNALGVSVTPGTPGLTGICTGTSGCTPAASACAVQGLAIVQVFLAGANFAKPDLSGNGESTVHAASSSCRTAPATCPVPDFVIPASAVTVTDPQHLAIDFDTTTAVPDAYDITVWNPGPSGVVKSPAVAFTVKASGTCP